MKKFDDAVLTADYYARVAAKVTLDYLEENYTVDAELRKTILDSINDFKRNIIRYIYEINV